MNKYADRYEETKVDRLIDIHEKSTDFHAKKSINFCAKIRIKKL